MKPTIQKQSQRSRSSLHIALIHLGAAVFPVSPARAATESARVVKYAKKISSPFARSCASRR